MCIVSHLSSFVTMLTAVHITLTILILPLARTTLDTNVSLDIFLMQLPRLVTKLEISKEEIPTQQGLKQLIIMSVLLIQRQGIRRPYLVALTFQMLSLFLYICLIYK